MALSELFEWRRTSQALLSLEELLKCSVCASLTTQLRHVGQCEHVLCEQCVSTVSSGECGLCHAPCESRECRPASAHASLVYECQQLRKLLKLTTTASMAAGGDGSGAMPSAQQLVDRVVETARQNDTEPPNYTRKGKMTSEQAKKRRRRAKPQSSDEPAPFSSVPSSTSGPLVAAIELPPETSDNTSVAAAAAARAKANKKNAKGETPLHVACARGDIERVRRLLSSGALPNVSDHAGWAPLHEAGSSGASGAVETVQLLLGAGAVVDAAGDENRTPLHEAVSAGNSQVAGRLVQAGANIHARSLYGETPLQLASGNELMLAALQETECLPISVESGQKEDEGRLVTAVVAEGLTEADTVLLKAVAKKYGWKMRSEVSVGVSHLILGSSSVQECSFSRLCALQVGAHQVSPDWLHACASSTLPLPPSPLPWQLPDEAIERSVSRARSLKPLLLSGLHLYLQGEFDGAPLQRAQLCQVLQLAGASLLSRPPNPEAIPASERTVPFHAQSDSLLYQVSHVVVYRQRPSMRYDMAHVKSLPSDWLLLCLQTYTLADPF